MLKPFKSWLLTGVADIGNEEILERMGYRAPVYPEFDRLHKVLHTDDYGLESTGYDLKHTSESFLQSLCGAVGMPRAYSELQIQRIHQWLAEDRAAYRPFVWINTNFKRRNEPVFALAAIESRRYLTFERGFWRYAYGEQLDFVAKSVKDHWLICGGDLGLWGRIDNYWFYHRPKEAVILSPQGEVVGEHTGSVPNQASLHGVERALNPTTVSDAGD